MGAAGSGKFILDYYVIVVAIGKNVVYNQCTQNVLSVHPEGTELSVAATEKYSKKVKTTSNDLIGQW